jgi:hypothetical protein
VEVRTMNPFAWPARLRWPRRIPLAERAEGTSAEAPPARWLLCAGLLAGACSEGDAPSSANPSASSLPNCPAAEAPPREAVALPPPPTLPRPYTADATLSRYFERELLGSPALAPIDHDDLYEHATELAHLSGKGIEDAVDWDFMVTGGRNAGAWSTLPVPSNWEFHGFGSYTYGRDGEAPERGLYRKVFDVPAAWRGRRVFLVFEGAMTDAEVKLNGESAGPVHRGAFYRFQHEVTRLLDFEHPNLLEVAVDKHSADASVNAAERQADYWVFGGIFRPVYLAAYPEQFIERLAVDARAGGELNVDVFLQGLTEAGQVRARVFDDQLQPVGDELSAVVDPGAGRVRVSGTVPGIEAWSPERPRRYRVEVSLATERGVVHALRENIGFRTVEVRAGDGIYVNGIKRKLRGVNRHTFWPNSGRATSELLSHYDVRTLKSLNANAVRSSHYPPDRHFLDACDREGLFVLDELAGWHASYDSGVGRQLAKEMVAFDVNHPSIIFWDNGNEGGWNVALDRELLRWDPQRRNVLHPWSTYSGINTQHYPSYARLSSLLEGQTIYLSTEFSHAMYDQGGGASLEDYWNLMQSTPIAAGGFIWAMVDEGAFRTDSGTLDTAGNAAPDGIFGPYREKEGSFYSIRQIWSPIQIALGELGTDFTGSLPVQNRYDTTDLADIRFHWQLESFSLAGPAATRVAEGDASLALAPGASGALDLVLPVDWQSADVLGLEARDAAGLSIARWSWPVRSAAAIRQSIVPATSVTTAVVAGAADAGASEPLRVDAGPLQYTFSRATGQLVAVENAGQPYSLSRGPALVAGEATLESFEVSQQGTDIVITATYSGNLESVTWRVLGNGWLTLDYRYTLSGSYEFLGVTFDYPEAQVAGIDWLGRGPFRAWKNRVQGPWLGLWQRDSNDAITGQQWDYPEFKGYFADVSWARLSTSEGPIHMVFGTDHLFLRHLTPTEAANPLQGPMTFPSGNISFLHGIPPIGTFTLGPAELGPQSQPNAVDGPFEASVSFYFGERP